MIAFREAFPDLEFGGAADLIAEGDYVVGQWKGGGTHTARLSAIPHWFAAGRVGPQDAVHGDDRASRRERQGQEEIGLDDV